MLRSCRHANIVRYHESFFDDGAVTIVMEYLNRGSLSDLFTNFKHIPERFLALIMTQVTALMEAHGLFNSGSLRDCYGSY